MTDNNVIRPPTWRSPISSEPTSGPQKGRILLLVKGPGNRRQLTAQLGQQFTLVETENNELPLEGFDLAIVDGPGFQYWHKHLTSAKAYEQPVFLPVMLMLARRDLRKRAGPYWDIIDEFIVTPIERTEFHERVSMLLRTRQLAKEQREELAHLITHDAVTGLPNQTLFMDRLHTAIANASIMRTNLHVLVIYVPLDRIMTSLGHDALTKAIQTCAVRFQRELGEGYSLARLTTQEWGVLIKSGATMENVASLGRRLAQCLQTPILIGKEPVHIDAYLGVSTYPDDAATGEELLNDTLSALARARTPGEPYFYSKEEQNQALRYIRTETKLHEALETNQFELWFQPQFRLEDRAITGAEALIRWRLPSGELVHPGSFIPVAETSGLIQRIDRWVTEVACRTLGTWREKYGWNMRVAVNLTPVDIAQPDFVPWVKHLAALYHLPPPRLELELTETMFCDTEQSTINKINELREYGVTVAIDDFGTGYSSLSYLHQLPINVLKIDKSFVDNVPGSKQSEGITEAIIGLAHRFDLEIIAEGIETQVQLDYLKALGVHTGQGYLIGRPMPDADFRRFCENQTIVDITRE